MIVIYIYIIIFLKNDGSKNDFSVNVENIRCLDWMCPDQEDIGCFYLSISQKISFKEYLSGTSG